MKESDKIKIIAMEFVFNSDIPKKEKIKKLEIIKELTTFQCIGYILDGKFYKLNEQGEVEILKRFIEEKQKVDAEDVIRAGTGAYVGKAALDHGLHRVAGLRGEFHSTPDGRKIKKGGYLLDPKKGGTGASRAGQQFVDISKNKVYITGYNKKTADMNKTKGFLNPLARLDTDKKIQNAQPMYKYNQSSGYKKGGKYGIDNKISSKHSKTFHIVAPEDFYNKHFEPDIDDMALMTKKKLKVSSSRLGATAKALKKYGLKGLKSSPKSRPIIGAATLAGGAYLSKKLSDPLLKKLTIKRYEKIGVDFDYLKRLDKQNKQKQAQSYLLKRGIKRNYKILLKLTND